MRSEEGKAQCRSFFASVMVWPIFLISFKIKNMFLAKQHVLCVTFFYEFVLNRQKPKVNWLLRLADRITSSRYFQNAMNIERIKKVMESVSSKSLLLSVELHAVKGTMAVNIPPPPTDRIWSVIYHCSEFAQLVLCSWFFWHAFIFFIFWLRCWLCWEKAIVLILGSMKQGFQNQHLLPHMAEWHLFSYTK